MGRYTILDWKSCVLKIKNKHKIYVEAEEAIGGYIKFSLKSISERDWLIKTIKENFFASSEFIGFESIRGSCDFQISSKQSPEYLVNGFNIDLFPVPLPSYDTHHLEQKKEDSNFFARVSEYFSDKQEVSFVDTRKSDLKPKEQDSGYRKYILPETLHKKKTNDKFEQVRSTLEEQTWKQFFDDLGYRVTIRERRQNDGEFMRYEFFFFHIDEIEEFKRKAIFSHYKFSVCVDKKRKLLIRRSKPNPK